MRIMQRLSAVSLLLLLAAVPSFAQRSTGTIRGTVVDPQNLVVQGADVTVRNEETGLIRTTKTNSVGIYVFTELPVGSYEVTVKQPGFRDAIQKNIVLNVADTIERPVKL